MPRLLAVITIALFSINFYPQVPKNADEFNARANDRRNSGDFGGAIEDFTRVIALTSSLNTKNERLSSIAAGSL